MNPFQVGPAVVYLVFDSDRRADEGLRRPCCWFELGGCPERARSLCSAATFSETSVRVRPRTCRRTALPAAVRPMET